MNSWERKQLQMEYPVEVEGLQVNECPVRLVSEGAAGFRILEGGDLRAKINKGKYPMRYRDDGPVENYLARPFFSVTGYHIVHQSRRSRIGGVLLRVYNPTIAQAAIFGHMEIDSEYRGLGLGLATHVAAQLHLPSSYRLHSSVPRTSAVEHIWENLVEAGLAEVSIGVHANALAQGIESKHYTMRVLNNAT